MYDYVVGDYFTTIEEFRDDRIQVCKDLRHWRYLTKDERLRFKASVDENEITRLLITARTRAYNHEVSQL